MTVSKIGGTKLLVQIGNDTSPQGFAHDCLINTSRGIVFNSETNRVIIPDCANPDDPAWSDIYKDGLSGTITGAGRLNLTSVQTWFNWYNSDDFKEVRFNLNETGGGYWEGSFKLTQWEITGERANTAESAVTLESHGPLAYTPA